GRAVKVDDVAELTRDTVEGIAPPALGQLPVAGGPHERRAQTVLVVDRLVAEPALVAQPPLVDGIAVDTEITDEPVRRRLGGDATADGALGARRLDLFQVPRTGAEAVGAGEQGADGTDLHGVAAEVRGERFVGEGEDLHLVAACDKVDQRVTCDLVSETR